MCNHPIILLICKCKKLADGVSIKNGRDGVHLTLSREGRPSGEAYIEVSSEDDVALAEKKHNQHMGRRYIEGEFFI